VPYIDTPTSKTNALNKTLVFDFWNFLPFMVIRNRVELDQFFERRSYTALLESAANKE
jgi:hypothetical protein